MGRPASLPQKKQQQKKEEEEEKKKFYQHKCVFFQARTCSSMVLNSALGIETYSQCRTVSPFEPSETRIMKVSTKCSVSVFIVHLSLKTCVDKRRVVHVLTDRFVVLLEFLFLCMYCCVFSSYELLGTKMTGICET